VCAHERPRRVRLVHCGSVCIGYWSASSTQPTGRPTPAACSVAAAETSGYVVLRGGLLCCSLPWCWLAGGGCGGAVRVQRDPPRFHHIDTARNACRPALRKAQCRRRLQSLAQSQRSSAPSVLPPPASSHACVLAARLTRSPTSCDVGSGFIWSHGGAMLTPYRTFYRRSAGRAASLLPLRLRWLYDLIAFVLTSAIFREPLTSHE
jgi:hypothetical protein